MGRKAWTPTLEEKRILRLAARLPMYVPAAKRREAAALINRFNYGNLLGGWQMDPADGETLYVTCHLFGDHIPDDKTIHSMIGIAAWAMGNEGPQILRMIQKPNARRVDPETPARN